MLVLRNEDGERAGSLQNGGLQKCPSDRAYSRLPWVARWFAFA